MDQQEQPLITTIEELEYAHQTLLIQDRNLQARIEAEARREEALKNLPETVKAALPAHPEDPASPLYNDQVQPDEQLVEYSTNRHYPYVFFLLVLVVYIGAGVCRYVNGKEFRARREMQT